MHLPALISDLALILIVSGVVAIIFKFLNQPIVLGYLIAGILVGPEISFFPSVVDVENIKAWAELGVIFLLFLLGLEFSFKKLIKVGRPAVIAAAVEVVGMLGFGYLIGWALGWERMDAIFLGAILSISSTTIIIKAFDELSVKTQLFASTVFGILVVEDLFAILLLAFLSTFAVTRSFEGVPMLVQIGKLMGFLGILIPLGLAVMPVVLRRFRAYFNDETRVIVSLGLCLGLVVLSTWSGFSPALGAFLMGAFMAETVEGERIERFLKPIKDLFGAIFFTSVGTLVDIQIISEHIGLILLIGCGTVIGKIVTTSAGMILAGQDRRVALQTGLSLAQIGEFSFIIATLGMSLNVIRPELYPMAVAVSLITTFITPYFIKLAASMRAGAVSFSKSVPRLWNGHLVELEIHPHFKHAGQNLKNLGFREKFGVTVVSIHRGERKIVAPNPDEIIMPFDRIIVLGSDEQLKGLELFLRSERLEIEEVDDVYYSLEKLTLTEDSFFVGKSLRESNFREKTGGIVLGIERKDERYLNPDSLDVLKKGDILWLYGKRDMLREFLKA